MFDQLIAAEEWRSLQSDLLEYADGDRALKNPSRVMRLAGAYHVSSKGYVQSRIVTHSGKRYSYSDLRVAIPKNMPLPKTTPPIPVTGSGVPLTCCLTRNDRALIEQGVQEGGRNTNGAKLARNLIGTANRLHELAISFEGDPRQLLDDYCSRCSPPLDAKEAEAIWRSAEKDNPKPSLSDDALLVCVRAYERRQASHTELNSPNASWFGRIKDAAVETVKQILPVPKSDRSPAADIIAREIAEQYKNKFKFNNSIGSWMHYEVEKQGTWAIETDEYMESLIKGILDEKGISGYGAYSYVTNVLKNMRCILITRKWNEASPNEILPFMNGVLHVPSQKLLPHDPDYQLTWQLPREYNPLATGWGAIENFLPSEEYAAHLRKWAGITNLVAGVTQDYMCEKAVLDLNNTTVAEQQRKTIARYDELLLLLKDSGIYLMPVLQGYEPEEYVDCILLSCDTSSTKEGSERF